ncbi:Copper amine oxidase, N2/N3-terminal [Artemisia annua]|uniref:Copper amine oxidase, N2/N3-terminal n=2 Tax=Artemisia annua TaxID=35608 RepID=A0A2U1LZA9_ARTAN|nr:Copper amine oxidase, N2/N3-terminal [Artemisia annua]
MKTISSPCFQISINPQNPFHSTLCSANPLIISFPHRCKMKFAALRTSGSGGGDLLRRPNMEVNMENGRGSESWLDYEDQILEDTVPLVGFVRMILHSGKYESGERLSADHESMILQRLLAYHPESEKKIGSGIDYIMVGDHPDFESSRCMFIVRKNGDIEDFSYWKCIKGLIRKKYPLYADSFINQHFKKRRNFS